MSFARPATPSSRALNWSIDRLYFILAGIDLVTICAVLLLSHMTVSAFEQGVRKSVALSTLQVDIARLASLAYVVDAPANDVFSSRAPKAERTRFLTAFTRYEAAHQQALQDVASASLGEGGQQLLRHLDAAHRSIVNIGERSEQTFSQYRRGDVAAAASSMAAMDREHGVLHATLDQGFALVDRLRTVHLEEQLAIARRTRQLETVFAVGVFFIVCLVAVYGLHIGRTFRATERLKDAMVDQIAAARDRLEHYADDVSHELRGPVSQMRLATEVLLMQPRSAEEYREGLEGVLSESERLSSIVESLLFLARAENTPPNLARTPLDARHELELMVDFYGASAELGGIELRMGEASGKLEADRALFQRALGNLVSNAIRHTPAGGAIVVSARQERDDVVVEVTDTGAGIAPDHQPFIFDRFTRSEASPGLGLGLAIARSIMELHRGDIAIQSQPDKGTTATLRFPRMQAAA